MPGYDGTGPEGQGPYGRGLGPCGAGRRSIRRGLFGFRRGSHWRARGYGWVNRVPVDPETELTAEKNWLKQQLDMVNQRLSELKKE